MQQGVFTLHFSITTLRYMQQTALSSACLVRLCVGRQAAHL